MTNRILNYGKYRVSAFIGLRCSREISIRVPICLKFQKPKNLNISNRETGVPLKKRKIKCLTRFEKDQ